MFSMCSFNEGGHAFHSRAGMFGSAVSFLKAESITLMLSAELGSKFFSAADSPSTFRDMMALVAGVGLSSSFGLMG